MWISWFSKIFFSFRVNEKNNVVLRTQDYFNTSNNRILGIPTPLHNCSVVSKSDWICGNKKKQKIKINTGAYIDLVHNIRHVGHRKNLFDYKNEIIHIMRDGQYSVLQYDSPNVFECAK